MLDIGLETLELPGVRVHARIGACSCPCGDAGFLECAETGSCRWTPCSQPSAPATPTPATST